MIFLIKFNPDWVDANIEWLKSKTGINQPFEPCPEFYERLGKAGLSGSSGSQISLEEACYPLFQHVNRPSMPISFWDVGENSGNFFCFLSEKGDMSDRKINISGRYYKMEDPMVKGYIIGAIIAHELTHDVLFSLGIQREHDANETLTDLTSVALGFGKLILNGRMYEMKGKTCQLGYLSVHDMVYAYREVNKYLNIPEYSWMDNLTEQGKKMTRQSYLEILDYRKNEQAEETKKSRDMLRKKSLGRMEVLVENCCTLIEQYHQLSDRYSAIRQKQDQLDSSYYFWEISKEDGEVFCSFTQDVFFERNEIRFSRIEETLLTLRRDCNGIATRLKSPSITEGMLKEEMTKSLDCKPKIESLGMELSEFSGTLSNIEATQKRNFEKMSPVMPLLQTTEKNLNALISARSDLDTRFHAFIRLPDIQDGLLPDDGTIERISRYFVEYQNEVEINCIWDCLQRMSALLSTEPVDYKRLSKSLPAISSVISYLHETGMRIVHIEEYVSRITGDFNHIEAAYIKLLDDVDRECEASAATIDRIKKVNGQMILNQQSIDAQFASLTIEPEDNLIFEKIIRGIYTREIEDQIHVLNKEVTTIQTKSGALRSGIKEPETGHSFDADDRIASIRGALEPILPRIAALDAMVSEWLAVQEWYLPRSGKARISRLFHRFARHR